MRTVFYEQLSALSTQVGEMCGLAADAMEHATQALLGADLSVAEQVITDHQHITAMNREAEDRALKLLALQQPVASDLRTIVRSLHVGADIERMGALAVHVATISRRRHPECAVPEEVRGRFAEMGSRAVQLARTAQRRPARRPPRPRRPVRLPAQAVAAVVVTTSNTGPAVPPPLRLLLPAPSPLLPAP